MKKLVNRLRKEQQPDSRPSERITNDTVSEHRRQVLAGGRKFKYPIQYSRHKLVINTIVITVLSLAVVGIFGWWQFYPQQNSGSFAYRVASVVPLPVAKVDGQYVRYSDYLLKFRSAEHYLQQKEQVVLSGDDGERQRAYLKRQSLEDAVADAYAVKLAQEKNITVEDEELSAFLKSKRQMEGGDITERTHYAVIRDYYDWSPAEYEHIMRTKLLRQKVAFAIDEQARDSIQQIKELASAKNARWDKIAQDQMGEGLAFEYGASGLVPKTNQDGGLAAAAATLAKGEMSDVIMSTTEEGYYYSIIRLLDTNDTQVNYEFIRVPLSTFALQVESLYRDEKVNIYIDVPSIEEVE